MFIWVLLFDNCIESAIKDASEQDVTSKHQLSSHEITAGFLEQQGKHSWITLCAITLVHFTFDYYSTTSRIYIV